MLSRYIQAAMHRARYEMLEDDGSFYGEILDCPGVWANAGSLEECRDELAEVFADWLSIPSKGLGGLVGLWDDGDEFADEVDRVVASRPQPRNLN